MKREVKLVRVDKRLLHATVALNWNRFVNANHIAIVDPDSVNDPFLEKVMQLSLHQTTKVSIFSVDQLLSFLEEEMTEKKRVIILFKNLASLDEAVSKGFSTKEVQMPYPASRMLLKKMSDYFTDTEQQSIQDIRSKGIKFFFQTSPMDTKDYAFFKSPH